MSSIDRRRRNKENVRENILTTARKLAGAEGWQAVSMRKIADEIDYTAPIIYEHFESKDRLLYEVNREGFRILLRYIRQAESSAVFPEERLLKISLAHWQFAAENPELYQVMFGLQGASCNHAQHENCAPTTEMREGYELVHATLHKVAPELTASVEELKGIWMNWWSLVHGFIALDMQGQFHEESETVKQSFSNAIQRFIGTLK
jgi:AcrR family transcriptional regulator